MGGTVVVCVGSRVGGFGVSYMDQKQIGGRGVWSVHQRMAELWTIQKKRTLTDRENTEMCHCLEANMRRAWKLAHLYNLSLIASMTNDTTMQHEICAKIDEIENN